MSDGSYKYCRWSDRSDTGPSGHIRNMHPISWFQDGLADVRKTFLQGAQPPGCGPCRVMEQHGKISGRQKQLLKTGVQVQDFGKTMRSSPWMPEWQYSQEHQGHTQGYVQDWQIDLGNFCNSACLFCSPDSSSKIASERLRLGMIDAMPPRPWCEDPVLLERFIHALQQAPKLRYLHFLGGETLITPGFSRILQALSANDLSRHLTIGFTTNLTVFDPEIVSQLLTFDQVHLGMSIECLDRVNDYVRYGSEINRALDILTRWLDVAKTNHWLVQLRTTPTALTVSRLWSVYEYAWHNQVIVESCNFIDEPSFMRPSVLPAAYRQEARQKLASWIADKQFCSPAQPLVNIRHPDQVHQQLLEDAQSYLNYLDHESDASARLPDLASYLKIMDQSRGNKVTDYLPEYEELLRSAGY